MIFTPQSLLVSVFLCFSFISCSANRSLQQVQQASGQRQGALAFPAALSPVAQAKIAQKIWQNECGGTIDGLISWNEGEGFASMGIGHFLWFPARGSFPFAESFPNFLAYAQSRGLRLPAGLAPQTPCFWQSRQEYNQAKRAMAARYRELRAWLASTVNVQADFLVLRSRNALGRILSTVAPTEVNERSLLEARYAAVASSPQGQYALIDYVNFKGEGIKPEERHRGQGWGLLQVLKEMRGDPRLQRGDLAAAEFSAAAKRTLSRRVQNALPKDESRWLKGWHNRCDTYARPLVSLSQS